MRNFQLFGGEVEAPVTSGRILGAYIQFGDKPTAGCHKDRIKAAVARARRAKWRCGRASPARLWQERDRQSCVLSARR